MRVTPVRLTISAVESARFGLSIARWTPIAPHDVADLDQYDIVIVRRPAGWIDSWHELASIEGYTALHADTLMYWEWPVGPVPGNDREAADLGVASARWSDGDGGRIAALVTDVFVQYQNHYSANPLLDPARSLAGYVEWAGATAAASAGALVELVVHGDVVGFGVVDWEASHPDIRLAGVSSAHRGRGWYRVLMSSIMQEAVDRDVTTLRISTQAQNITVQRTWSALGWRPVDAFDTIHLVRTALLR